MQNTFERGNTMYLEPANKPTRFYKKSQNLELLEKFISSDHECVIVKDCHHKNAYSCAASLRNSVKRFRMSGIIVVVREGRVYLIKK